MFENLSIKTNKGFTFLETVFAIFIISVGILGSYTVIQESISEIHQSSIYLTADYLAQEGLEIVRNIRDTNWLNGDDWNKGLAQCPNGEFHQAEYFTNSLDKNNCGANRKFLKIKNGYYCYSGNFDTPFVREIKITPDGNDKLKVSVSIFWKYKGAWKGPVTVQEILYNWLH